MDETVLGKSRVTVVGETLTLVGEIAPILVIGTEPRIIGRDSDAISRSTIVA